MSDRKIVNFGTVEAIEKVTRCEDTSEKHATEENRLSSSTTNLSLWDDRYLISPDLLCDSSAFVSEAEEVSEADAIGRDLQAEGLIAIREKERCGGLYILGQPRTGKSNLLVRLALSDIGHGHGILFIDPHTDAITDLVYRIPESRRDDVILLDPTDHKYSFCINPLRCADPSNALELDKTVGRVRDIFVKVWGDERGQLGVWLDKIIRNAVSLLLENPGYTLVDLPLLLWEDTTFRNSLLANLKVKTTVRDFWYYEFDRLTKRDRTEQVGPAISRLDIFRGNNMVRDIVGQEASTIDFAEILSGRHGHKIVLLRLPTNLASDVKHLIGTMVLSEVLHAAFAREALAERDRPYFGIYCDEFQEFATPDFARLFTQTGKYKVMPVVAHQTRLGQFKPGDPNQGATLASPNKVLFTLSSADARELALEFSEEPPTETRLEEQLVISDEPVRELLRGRHKPEIQEFVDKYLRHLQWRREDTREEIEGEHLLRLSDLDEVSLYGIDERIAYANRYLSGQVGALKSRGGALLRAQTRTQNLLTLHETSQRLRLTFRGLNTFLIEVMEGKKKPGQEAFSDFLVDLAASTSSLTETETKILELYIRLSYGDRKVARSVPFELSRAHGLFSREVALLTNQSEKETKDKREEFAKKYIHEQMQKMEDRKWMRTRARSKKREEEEQQVWHDLDCPGTIEDCFGSKGKLAETAPKAYTAYVWYCCCFRDDLAPYTQAKFASSYARRHNITTEKVKQLTKEITDSLTIERGASGYKEWLKPNICRDLKKFLYTYQEAALIILCLLRGKFVEIDGWDPVDVWVSIVTLVEVMRKKFEDTHFVNNIFSSYFRMSAYFGSGLDYSREEFVSNLKYLDFLDPMRDWVFCDYKLQCRSSDALLNKRWGWFSTHSMKAAQCWKGLSEPKRFYLMVRALVSGPYESRWGEIVDHGILPTSTNPEYEEVVEALRSLMRNDRRWCEEAEEREAVAQERQEIERDCRFEVAKIAVSAPAYLEPRVLSGGEMQAVRTACAKELGASEGTKRAVATIDDFASFCGLLAKPENHIRIKGQYREKQVPLRQEADMVNEMARRLTGLPKYTAYARVVEEKGGESIVWKGRIRTLKLPDVREDEGEAARLAVGKNVPVYCRPRRQIQEEIERRQEKWRGLRVRVEEEKKPKPPWKRAVSVPEEPPPIRAATMRKPEGKKVWEYLEVSQARERGAGAGDPIPAQAGGEGATGAIEDSRKPRAPVRAAEEPDDVVRDEGYVRPDV